MAKIDRDLKRVFAKLHELDPTGERTANVLRETLDQLYDGQHTGRYRWDQLHKTEKTHCGTLVEINLHREFGFADGEVMDYRIDGIEVDRKYSQSFGAWMIPPESMGHLCLVISADDQAGTWSLGVVRIEERILSKGGNRDAKRSITASCRNRITRLFENAALPPNILLQLSRSVVDEIMELNSGQKRIDQIFRVAQMRRIGRGVIATLGRQDDYMKRVRGNGGSRSRLKSEGILILGHYEKHRLIAESLGIPVPQQGESVSVRVARANTGERRTVMLDGQLWRVATPSDPIKSAPDCPHS